ncbi:unnamed protein product, partial [Heterosigma akashiwo]
MGVAPAVASATSAVMILYTSFSAATSFVVFGLLRGRGSYIMLSIGAVVALSTAMMGLQSAMAFADGTMGSGGGICS